MKTEIHPQYEKTIVTCTCGNTFESRSTVKSIDVEICSACHPFYTGKQKLVDTAGRVDRFKMKLEASAAKKATSTTGEKKERVKEAPKAPEVTLSEIKKELKEELVETTPTPTEEV